MTIKRRRRDSRDAGNDSALVLIVARRYGLRTGRVHRQWRSQLELDLQGGTPSTADGMPSPPLDSGCIYIYRTASTSQSDQTCAGLESPSYSWHWYRCACPDLQHLWLNDYRPRNPSSRFLQLSLPGRTLSRHIAWRRSLHSILIRRRWQYGPVWTSRRRCPVKEIRICTHTSSPATVSRRWIRYGVDVLVPTSRSLLYS